MTCVRMAYIKLSLTPSQLSYFILQLEIFVLLLQRGADPNATLDKSTLLCAAIDEGYGAYEEALLTHAKKTLDVNHTGKDMRTALMAAVAVGADVTALQLLDPPFSADPAKAGTFQRAFCRCVHP
jgi:hypothetical protein